MSTYFFHLGRNHIISLAEISAVFKDKIKFSSLIDNEILKVETNLETEVFKEKMDILGSITKISKLMRTVPRKLQTESITEETAQIVETYFLSIKNKCHVGLNRYGIKLPLGTIGMRIKKLLKSRNIKLRIIEKDKKNLNSVSIIKNKLITNRGADLNFISENNELHISRSVACQNSLFYSKRDYDRPRRNAKNGMLPPKLCQIMLNLADLKEEDNVLDPFCGVGTVLQEAMLKKLYFSCSDIRRDIIADCKGNLNWLIRLKPEIEKYYDDGKINIFDATKIDNCYQGEQFNAIVTEGTLGPAQSNFVHKSNIEKVFRNLKALYTPFFEKVDQILKTDGKLVITFPAIRSNRNSIQFFSDYFLPNIKTKLHKISEKDLINHFSLLQSKSLKLIYERSDQIVLREIVVFEKEGQSKR